MYVDIYAYSTQPRGVMVSTFILKAILTTSWLAMHRALKRIGHWRWDHTYVIAERWPEQMVKIGSS